MFLEQDRSSAKILHGPRTDLLDPSFAETGHECVQVSIGQRETYCRGRVEVLQDEEQDFVADIVE